MAMCSCEEIADVVGGLQVDAMEGLSRLGDFPCVERCILDGLTSSATTEDWSVFERYLLAAARYPDERMTIVLCDVLGRRLEDVNNEDIVDVLAVISDPRAVGVLEESMLWGPPWDEFNSIAVKCVWALAAISTHEALEVLRGVAAVGPAAVREAAGSKLRFLDQD